MFNRKAGDATGEWEETDWRKRIRHPLIDSVHSDSEEISFDDIRCKVGPIEQKLEGKEFDLNNNFKPLLRDCENLMHRCKRPSSNIYSCKNEKDSLVLPSECPKEKKSDHYKKSVEKELQDFEVKLLKMMHPMADHIDKTIKNFIESLQGKKIVNEEKIDKSRDIIKIIESLKKRIKRMSSSSDSSKNEENVLDLPSESPKEKSDHGVEKEMQTTADQTLGNLNAIAGRIVETMANLIDVLECRMLLHQKDEIPRDVINKIDECTSGSADDDSFENDALPKPSQNVEKWLKKIRRDDKLRNALERFFMSDDGSSIPSKYTSKATERSWWSEGHADKSFGVCTLKSD